MSRHFFPVFRDDKAAADMLSIMARAKPRRIPAFGQILERLRKETQGQQDSLDSVVRKLADLLGGHELSGSTLWNYEQGRPPEAAVLWALAKLYRRDVRDLLGLLVEEWRGVPLQDKDLVQTNAVLLTDNEASCLIAYRRLEEEQQRWFMDILLRLGDASGHKKPRGQVWDGVNRRTGVDRRKAS